jgi:hypothetical protein
MSAAMSAVGELSGLLVLIPSFVGHKTDGYADRRLWNVGKARQCSLFALYA